MRQQQSHKGGDQDDNQDARPVAGHEDDRGGGHGSDGSDLDVLIEDIDTILDDVIVAEEYRQKGGQ